MAFNRQVIFSFLLVLSVSGCASRAAKIEYITVCPEPPFIERPELDVLNLKAGDTPDTVIQAHRVTIKKLQKWGLEQEVILEGYKKEPK